MASISLNLGGMYGDRQGIPPGKAINNVNYIYRNILKLNLESKVMLLNFITAKFTLNLPSNNPISRLSKTIPSNELFFL